MSNALKYYEKIESYATGKMTKEEATQFEASLQTDATLAAEYKAYQASMKVLDFLAYEALEEPEKTETVKVIPFYRRSWAIAASFLILIVAGYFILNQLNQASNDYLSYYQRPIPTSVRGDEGASTVVRAFYSGDYQVVIDSFSDNSILENEERLYLGHAYLLSGKNDEAIIQYNLLEEEDNSYIQTTARWHRILARLQKGDEATALKELEPFLTQAGYEKLATQLKEDIQQ